jgi:hypothetical protein
MPSTIWIYDFMFGQCPKFSTTFLWLPLCLQYNVTNSGHQPSFSLLFHPSLYKNAQLDG